MYKKFYPKPAIQEGDVINNCLDLNCLVVKVCSKEFFGKNLEYRYLACGSESGVDSIPNIPSDNKRVYRPYR